MASTPDTPTPSDTPEDTPTPSPAPQDVNKFNWLKRAHAARNNPFVKARPSMNRESSTAELFSRENSSPDLFQSSRLNLFDTDRTPKPDVNVNGYGKVGLGIILTLWIEIIYFTVHQNCFTIFLLGWLQWRPYR